MPVPCVSGPSVLLGRNHLLIYVDCLQALVEMQAYLRSPAFRQATAAEARAAEDLQTMLEGAVQGPLPALLSVQSALQVPAPEVSDSRRLPLTW